MENQVTNALNALKFLTESIREPTSKPELRKPLQTSLEKTREYDSKVISRALDLFYGTGLKAVV